MLMKLTEVHKLSNEEEAVQMIERTKNEAITEGYTLTKSGYVLKTKKSKGEIIDSWTVITLEKTFNE